jgi:hypothetical protein
LALSRAAADRRCVLYIAGLIVVVLVAADLLELPSGRAARRG